MWRGDPHSPYERGHVLPAHRKAPITKLAPYPSDTVEGELHVDVVHGSHQGQIVLAGSDRFVVDAPAVEVEELACLVTDTGWALSDHRFALNAAKRLGPTDRRSIQ